MATLVGTQSDFKKAVIELLELEYDAREAYKKAIEKIESREYQVKLEEFQGDHERHIALLSKFLGGYTDEIPQGPSGKQILTKGKVILGNLFGDKSILAAMLSNEMDTNTAYENMSERSDQWLEIKEFLLTSLEDEKRHKAWLQLHASS